MAHTVTSADFEVRNGDLYYTGPLDEARQFIQRFHGTAEHAASSTEGPCIEVLVAYGHDTPTPADAAEWGRGPTSEDAWRWALAAVFGPIDEEFNDIELSVCAEFDEFGTCIHSDHMN